MATGGSQTDTEALEHFRWTKCERQADSRDVRRINRHTASLPLRTFVLNSEPPLISHFFGWLQTSTSGRGLFPAPTGTDGDTCGQSNNKPKMPHPVFVPSLPSDLCLNAFQFQFLPSVRDWIGGASPRIPIKPASCFLPSVVSHVHAPSDQPLHVESFTNTRGSDVRHVSCTFNWIYANLFWSTDHSNTTFTRSYTHSYTDGRGITQGVNHEFHHNTRLYWFFGQKYSICQYHKC